MTFTGLLYTAIRLFQLVILIPIIGMLGYFVDAYTTSNLLTPKCVLVSFIAAVIAAVWCLFTLGPTFRRQYGIFVAFVDLSIVGTFIGGVYLLRGVSNVDCARFTTTNFFYTLGPFGVQGFSIDYNKTCALLKASFAFGIIAIFLFFVTFLLALLGGAKDGILHNATRRDYHSSRHSSRRSSHTQSRRGSVSHRTPSRHTSQRSRKY